LERSDLTDAGGLRARRRAVGRETILQQSKIDSRGPAIPALPKTAPPAYTVRMAVALLKAESESVHWTYADYKDWELKPRERYEIIYGEAYAMSAPNDSHQSILTELLKQIAVFLTGKACKVRPAPYDVRLFYEEDESDDTVVQPDISIICDREKLGKEGCRGAPDFVAEILSPSNTAIEMQRKFNLYRDAGVREYWVLDGENKTANVHLFEGDAATTRKYGEKDVAPVAVIEGLFVELGPVFAE